MTFQYVAQSHCSGILLTQQRPNSRKSDRLTQQPTHIAISSDSDVSFNQILNENEMTPIFENKMKSSAVSPLAIIHQNPRVSFRLSIVYASARLTVDVWDEGKLKKMMPWL